MWPLEVAVNKWLCGLLACTALFGVSSAFAAERVLAVPTLTDDQCVARDIAAGTGAKPKGKAALLPLDQEIICGGVVAGRVDHAVVAAVPAGQAGLAQAFAARRAREVVRLDCGADRFISNALVVPCRNRGDDGAVVLVVRVDGGVLTVAQGPVSTFPVLLAALGVERAAQSRPDAVAEVRGFWSSPVIIASPVDLALIRRDWRGARLGTSLYDHEGAEAALRRALEAQTRVFGANDVVTNQIVADLAVAVGNQGRYDEAEALLRRAGPVIETSPRKADRARLAGYQASIYAGHGNYDAALANARAAVLQWRDLADAAAGRTTGGQVPDPSVAADAELAMALNVEASLLLRMFDIPGAYARAAEALSVIDKAAGAPPWWKADVLQTLGEVSVAQSRISAAEIYFNKALAIRTAIFGEGAGTLRVRSALGAGYQAEAMHASAIIAYRKALEIARGLPQGASFFTQNSLVPFVSAVLDEGATLSDPVQRQGLYSEAFDAFQMVPSPLRERTLGLTTARLSANSPELAAMLRKLEDTLRDENDARAQLATLQAAGGDERNPDAENQMAAKAADLHREGVALRQKLEKDYPSYTALADGQRPNLTDVRQRLAGNEALVSFLVGRDKSFAMLVRRDRIAIAPVPLGAEAIEAAVRKLRRGLEIEGRSVGEFDLEAASQLHNDLLGGVTKDLSGVDRLIVVSSGALANLPFGVLISQKPKRGDYRGAHWLVRDMAVTHTPSLPAFLGLRSTKLVGQQPKLMLAMADPVLGPAKGNAKADSARSGEVLNWLGNCRPDGPVPAELLRTMPSLPDTAEEVRNVARAMGPGKIDILTGAAATESAFRNANPGDYRVLYFATHGLLPGELRCVVQPGLALTPPLLPAKTADQDGLLDAGEIGRMTLRADLVVLSACNTAGPGKQTMGGDTLSGLAESFFYAGARSLVASHWQVPSAATTRLMSGLFQTLGADGELAADEALRRAQLRMIDDAKAAHPFFWGAFVILGDGAAKPLAKRGGA